MASLFALCADWCPRPDSNRHGFLHTPLKRARLPIPPLGQGQRAMLRYFLVAGAVGAAAGVSADMTEVRGRACNTASASEVTTKATKKPVVSLCRSVVAPR